MFRTVRFLGLILVLVLALGAPPAFAAGSRAPEGLSVHGLVAALWDVLVERLPDFGLFATSTSGDEPVGGPGDPNSGPGMDPNGKPTGP